MAVRPRYESLYYPIRREANMTATEMIRLTNRKPFEPLDIYLADGAKIRVEYPYQIATRPNSPMCFIYDVDDEMRFVSYRNITQVVTKSPTEDS